MEPRRHMLIALLVPVLSAGCGPTSEPCVEVLEAGGHTLGFDSLQLALDTVGPGTVMTLCAAPPAESLTVRQPVVLQGSCGTRLQGPPGAPTLRIEPTAGGRVLIRDVSLVAPDASDQPAVVMRGPAELRAEHVRIESGADARPFAEGVSGLVDVESGRLELRHSVVEHRVEGAGSAVAARSGASLEVEASTLRSTGEEAVLLEGSDGAFTDVGLDQSVGDALRMVGGRATLLRVNVTAAGASALSFAAANVVVRDSTLSGAGGSGIEAVGGTVELRGVTIAGAGGDGIHTEGSVFKAERLSVSAVGGDGIEVIAGALDLQDAKISGSEGHGLVATFCEGGVRATHVETVKGSALVSTHARLALTSLQLQGAARNGFEVVGGEVTASGLHIQSHVRNGILVDAGAYLNCSSCVVLGGIEGARVAGGSLLRMTDSRIQGPINYGISLRDESFAFVKSTEIHGAGTGIFVQEEYAQFTATQVAVVDSVSWGVLVNAGTLSFLQSRASGSGSDGLRVSGGTVTVSDSSFQENALNGISLLGTTRAQVRASVLDNGDWGLLCDGGAEDPTDSTVRLQICDLGVSGNGTGPVRLMNGCQQEQFCTVGAP